MLSVWIRIIAVMVILHFKIVLEWDPCVPNPCNNGGKCRSHLKEINELHLHEGALQSLIHGADESVVDVVEPEEESLGDTSFAMNHHPVLYEEHDQATNSEVQVGMDHLRKQMPRFDSDITSPWPSKSHLFHDDEDDDKHFSYHLSDKAYHANDDDGINVHVTTLTKQVQPQSNAKGLHRDVSFEEANSIHGADSDGHPHEGEHPFTEHHPLPSDDDDTHHLNLFTSDDKEKENKLADKVALAKVTNFKSHSGGIEDEVDTFNGKGNDATHKEAIHSIDQDTVAEITKNVVNAVMKAKYSKKSKMPKKRRGGQSEIRKRTIHNLYVCECPPGFLGAHCQCKYWIFSAFSTTYNE